MSDDLAADIASICMLLDRRTLRWAKRIDAPAERVWQAVTSEDEMARWFMRSRLDLRVGGEALFHLDDPFGGTISKLEQPRVFEVVYGDGFFRIEIGDDEVAFVERLQTGAPVPGDETDPALIPAGGPGTHWPFVAAGWHDFLDRLDAHVTGRPMPDGDRFDALVARYAKWLPRQHASAA